MEIIKKNIVLTYDELRILLYSQGYRRCVGVYMPYKDYSAEDIITALKKLEENGLLAVDQAEQAVQALPLVFGEDAETAGTDDAESEEFYIRSDLLDMIRVIGSPDATEIIQPEPGRNVFCYISERGIVTSERYPGRKECVRLSYYNAEDFEDWRNSLKEVEE